MSERIALIGAGAMGGAIGTRLLETGNTLWVFDLDTARVDDLVAKGAVAATSAAVSTGRARRFLPATRSSSKRKSTKTAPAFKPATDRALVSRVPPANRATRTVSVEVGFVRMVCVVIRGVVRRARVAPRVRVWLLHPVSTQVHVSHNAQSTAAPGSRSASRVSWTRIVAAAFATQSAFSPMATFAAPTQSA